MDRRKLTNLPLKGSDLPHDFIQMVEQVFNKNFDTTLKALKRVGSKPSFVVYGKIFPDEVMVTLSILNEGKMSANTLYASCDFDPKASSPTVQDVLNLCVDTLGTLMTSIYDLKDKERLKALADGALADLDNMPFEWTEIEIDKKKVFVKLDKANPRLEQMTEAWLAKNDPDYQQELEDEEEEAEDLFIRGPKKGESVH